MALFGAIFGLVETVIKGIKNIPVSDLILGIIGFIPGIIKDVEEIVNDTKDGISKEEAYKMVCAGLEQFDRITGEEGMTIIRDMSKPMEEETLDALKTVIKNVCYVKLKIGESNAG